MIDVMTSLRLESRADIDTKRESNIALTDVYLGWNQSGENRDVVGPIAEPKTDGLAAKLELWLTSMGLRFNPFAPATWDAGDDAQLVRYLVGHEDFAAVWGDWVSTILAPTGGGKSAFRVRTAYAARIGEDGGHVFPLVYMLPLRETTLEAHLGKLTRAAAFELLLEIVYHPEWFDSLSDADRNNLRRILDQNAPGWERFLPQIMRAKGPQPLAETFDHSAEQLPNLPPLDRVQSLCMALQQTAPITESLPISIRWQQLTQLLMKTLPFTAVYILVDGVDAYPETSREPLAALAWLDPLLNQAESWAESRIYLKLFLPSELDDILWQSYPNLLTFPARFAKIVWTPHRLTKVIAARLRIASNGEFDSLQALCTPALPDLDQKLADMANPVVPREVLVLANRVLWEHIRRVGASGLLDLEDLNAARDWYRADQLGTGLSE
jgi:hypothetical protein